MATMVKRIKSEENVRVALIIEQGRLRPVWFEELDRPGQGRVTIIKVCSRWTHMEGTAKIINFAVWDGSSSYQLALNTRDFTWTLEFVEEQPFPG